MTDDALHSKTVTTSAPTLYRVTGMDCQSCVSKIEHAAKQTPGVEEVRVSLVTQQMTVGVNDPETTLPRLEKAVTALGYQLERIDSDDAAALSSTHVSPGYRRALWIVVALNGGYGLAEIVAGYFARSQALKADALDFLGDGIITLMGLIAVNWNLAWRAKAALVQGMFLAVLGTGVLIATMWRFFVAGQPEAEMMGVFGGIALAVNVAAALVLIPHRAGDANVRAVWLFSRNDAIGNVAVVIAAGLVAWSGTPWPDLAVALIIAGLFLHAAWSIIQDARFELHASEAWRFSRKVQ